MAITINGSGTVTGISAGGLPDGIITRAEIGYAGAILQVVQTTKTDSYSSTATAATAVTGMTVTITPSSASNKVLLLASIYADANPSAYFYFDDSTNILIRGDAAGTRNRAFWQRNSAGIESSGGNQSFTYLHSPATTSAITYRLIHLNPNSATVAINRTAFDADNSTYGRFASTIIAMEVAG